MAWWKYDQQTGGGELDYPALGFRAPVNSILSAVAAPDSHWSSVGAGPETVVRYAVGSDPSYVEPGNGHVLVWSDTANAYVPVPVGGSDPFNAALSAAIEGHRLGALVHHVDLFNGFFPANAVWVPAQPGGDTSTTLTAAVAAGATTLPVASGTMAPDGTALVVNPGTAQQQILRVTAGGGTTSLTVTPAVTTALSNGSSVYTLWTNESHLTTQGYNAHDYYIAQQIPDPGTGAKIVALMNSWGTHNGGDATASVLRGHITARFPTVTVVQASQSGNKSSQLISRFATDVPADADIVIFNEPSVNDVYGSIPIGTQRAHLETLARMTLDLGAQPVFVGAPPLRTFPDVARSQAADQTAQLWDGGATTVADATGIAAASYVTRSGFAALSALTTGSYDTAFGGDALKSLTTGTFDTAIGTSALSAATTGARNTAVGSSAALSTTTATDVTAIGTSAASANVTGIEVTALGSNALLSSTASGLTAVGYAALRANTTGTGNTAVGHSALRSNVTGTINTAVGYQALNTGTADANTAIGYQAGQLATTASSVTLLGMMAGRGITTGGTNTFVGCEAGYNTGSTANATTTAVGQTALGYRAGQSSATQANYITCVGWSTRAAGAGGVAIGTDSSGTPAASTAANEFALGTANHTIHVAGLLQLDQSQTTVGAAGAASAPPATPTKYLKVKDSAGTTYVIPAYAAS